MIPVHPEYVSKLQIMDQATISECNLPSSQTNLPSPFLGGYAHWNCFLMTYIRRSVKHTELGPELRKSVTAMNSWHISPLPAWLSFHGKEEEMRIYLVTFRQHNLSVRFWRMTSMCYNRQWFLDPNTSLPN